MKPGAVIRSTLCVAAAAGLACWLALEDRTRQRLGDEQKALKQQLDEMAGVSARNQQPSNLVVRLNHPLPLPDESLRELLRLRGEAGVLRRQAGEFEAAREENRKAHATLESSVKRPVATADYWPQESWTFSGYASPDAALQTSLWAANNGDLKALAASVTGDAQKMIVEDLGGKSEVEAAIKARDEVSSIKSVRVLAREAQSDGTVVLTAEFESRTDTHTGKLVMTKEGNDWKLSRPPR